MSFLFDKKFKKGIRWVWIIIASLIIISMVATLFAVGTGGHGI